MAAQSFTVAGVPTGIHKTLSGTTADTVAITTGGVNCRAQIINSSTTAIYARFDSTTAVAAADGTIKIPPGAIYEWFIGSGVASMSVVGNGDAYSVQAQPYGSW